MERRHITSKLEQIADLREREAAVAAAAAAAAVRSAQDALATLDDEQAQSERELLEGEQPLTGAMLAMLGAARVETGRRRAQQTEELEERLEAHRSSVEERCVTGAAHRGKEALNAVVQREHRHDLDKRMQREMDDLAGARRR